MRDAGRRAAAAERAVVDLAEALVLRGRVGEVFPATVVDLDGDRATVLVRHPAVETNVDSGTVQLGDQIEVRLREVDPTKRQVVFERT
jgi:exoribonuclease R